MLKFVDPGGCTWWYDGISNFLISKSPVRPIFECHILAGTGFRKRYYRQVEHIVNMLVPVRLLSVRQTLAYAEVKDTHVNIVELTFPLSLDIR